MAYGSASLSPWPTMLGLTIVVLSHLCCMTIGISINTNGSFVQAVSDFVTSENNALLDLQVNISLLDSNFVPASTSPDRGTLTIQNAAPSPGQVLVLDTSNKANLTPVFVPTAQLLLRGLKICNMCIAKLPWSVTPPSQWASALQIHLFNRSRQYLSHKYEDLTLYARPADIAHQLYSTYMEHFLPTSFRQGAVEVRRQQFLGSRAPNKATIVSATAYGMTYSNLWFEFQVNMTNVTFKMTTDPSDPLLQEMRANGQLQPAQWCNGTAFDLEPDNIDIAPQMFTATTAHLASALINATNYWQSSRAVKFTPTILVTADALINPEKYYPMAGDTIIYGPLSADGGVTLDLMGRRSTLHLPVLSAMYFQNLTLTGLNQSAVDTGTPATALPLWAISPSEYGAPYAYLDNVTLVLPVSDFLALYHPAKLLASGWDGCRKAPSGAPAYGLVDPRFRDISVFKVAPGSDPNAMINMVELVEYQGWGVRGTSVRVVPVVSVADIPLSTYQPCGGSGDDHDDNSLAIGVGVGVGVGGALLVAALIVLYLAYRRHAAFKAEQGSAADKGSSAVCDSAPSAATGLQGLTPTQRAVTVHDSATVSTPAARSAFGSRDSHMGGIGSKDVHIATTTAVGTAAAAALVTAAPGTAQQVERSGDFVKRDSGARLPSNVSDVTAKVKANQGLSNGGMSGNLSVLVDPAKAVREVANQLQRPEADKLVLSNVLGRGTWGVVYRGTWRNLPVAVKTLLLSDSHGATQLQRAITEAAVCASVNHRNLVATYHYEFKPLKTNEGLEANTTPSADSGSKGGGLGTSDSGVSSNTGPMIQDYKLYLVQELCSSTLAQCVRAHVVHDEHTGEPDLSLVLQLLLDLAMGLEHLHQKNIMHGDLKPANVMLKTDSTAAIGVVAKLTDFGLAATMDPSATHISNYNSGTPFYVAPEVASTHKASKASDIFSFGVMMWELHGGQPPWVRVPDRDGSARASYAPNPAFPGWRRDAPRRFISLAMHCLNADPKARPHVGEVVSELAAMLQALGAGYPDLFVYPPAMPAQQQAAPAPHQATPMPPGQAESPALGAGRQSPEPIESKRQLSAIMSSGQADSGEQQASIQASSSFARGSVPNVQPSTMSRLKRLVTDDEDVLKPDEEGSQGGE